jgi:hypothetical protein
VRAGNQRSGGRARSEVIAVLTGTRPVERPLLLRRGLRLEYATLTWNVADVLILAISAISADSVALAAFGLDSLVEILASAVVV